MDSVEKVFVINLARRPDRMWAFEQRFPYSGGANITILDAADGYDPQLLEKKNPLAAELAGRYRALRSDDHRPGLPRLRLGEFGCLVSHVAVYKRMVDEGIKNAVVFEDDALFCPGFASKWSAMVRAMGLAAPAGPSGFLYIGGRFQEGHRMTVFRDAGMGPSLAYHDFAGPWSGVQHDRTTHAYCLTLDVAEALYGYFLEGDGLCAPVDHSLLSFFRRRATAPLNAQPLLCHSPMNTDSDIQGRAGYL